MEDMRTYKTSTVNKDNNQWLAKYGNCRFVVGSVANNVKIRNFDIHDLVRDSFARHENDDKVDARGVMHCFARAKAQTALSGGFAPKSISFCPWMTLCVSEAAALRP
jgi:hypothetical protein